MSVVPSDMYKINVRLGNIILLKDAQLLLYKNFMKHLLVNIIFITLNRLSHICSTPFAFRWVLIAAG